MEGSAHAHHAGRSGRTLDMILTISVGSHKYAEMAFNLAVSAKFLDKGVKVAVLTDGIIAGRGEDIFDVVIPFKGNPFEAKTRLPELTPFERTLYLDADTVCLPGMKLGSLDGHSFAIHNYGWFDTSKGWRSPWATFDEIKQIVTGCNRLPGPVPAYQTSGIYFDNSQANVDLFSLAHSFYGKIQSKVTVKGFQPDELAFSCAGAVLQHQGADLPIAFPDTPGARAEILRKYQFLSLAGEIIPRSAQDIYRNVTTTAAAGLGLRAFPFDLKAKRMR